MDDFGKKGQIVNVPFRKAHKYLLLPGFAVYHTEVSLFDAALYRVLFSVKISGKSRKNRRYNNP